MINLYKQYLYKLFSGYLDLMTASSANEIEELIESCSSFEEIQSTIDVEGILQYLQFLNDTITPQLSHLNDSQQQLLTELNDTYSSDNPTDSTYTPFQNLHTVAAMPSEHTDVGVTNLFDNNSTAVEDDFTDDDETIQGTPFDTIEGIAIAQDEDIIFDDENVEGINRYDSDEDIYPLDTDEELLKDDDQEGDTFFDELDDDQEGDASFGEIKDTQDGYGVLDDNATDQDNDWESDFPGGTLADDSEEIEYSKDDIWGIAPDETPLVEEDGIEEDWEDVLDDEYNPFDNTRNDTQVNNPYNIGQTPNWQGETAQVPPKRMPTVYSDPETQKALENVAKVVDIVTGKFSKFTPKRNRKK